MDIGQLLESKDVRTALREFASAHKPAMTAEEFLECLRPQVRVVASLGPSLGKALGLRSATRRTFAYPQGPTMTCVALLCGLLSNGVDVETVEQSSTGDSLLVSGGVPSSALHFGGRIDIQISARGPESDVSMAVVFPGQLIAWGAGKRLLAKLRRELDSAVGRLRQCPSMSAY
jgi:hypothetical protein